MFGIDFPFMVRQAHHERKIRRLLNLNPFALSLSKGERVSVGYVLCRESPQMNGIHAAQQITLQTRDGIPDHLRRQITYRHVNGISEKKCLKMTVL